MQRLPIKSTKFSYGSNDKKDNQPEALKKSVKFGFAKASLSIMSNPRLVNTDNQGQRITDVNLLKEKIKALVSLEAKKEENSSLPLTDKVSKAIDNIISKEFDNKTQALITRLITASDQDLAPYYQD